MKRLKLIYNPKSGDRSFRGALDGVIEVFQQKGFWVDVLRSDAEGNIDAYVAQMHNNYDLWVAAGGDGTLNMVLNALLEYKQELDVPLGIIPCGTANDFAGFLAMPANPIECAAAIADGKIIRTDLGLVESGGKNSKPRYFANVCGAGLFTNIPQEVNPDIKSTLGKFAYYLKGIEQFSGFAPIPARISRSGGVTEQDIFLLLALNTAGTGGFDSLTPEASISDGLLDFVVLKSCTIVDLGKLLIKILRQGHDHLNDPNILYFRDTCVKLEFLAPAGKFDRCDIDGEWGPPLPVTIRALPGKMPIIVPQTFAT